MFNYDHDYRYSFESTSISNFFTPKIDMGTINQLKNDHINFEKIVLTKKNNQTIHNTVRGKKMPFRFQHP